MKKIIITLIVAFTFISFLPKKTEAQCRQQMVYSCATKGQGSIYLRDFNTKLKNKKNENGARWTVVLNKGARYRFNLCTPEGFENEIILTLYDSQHPEETAPYGATYDPVTKEHISAFDFVCGSSGMYYVSIRFMKNAKIKKTCAVGIMSFVGSN